MAENITLNPVATFQNDTTAVNTVNTNNTTITTAFQDVLSLSGQSPNQMKSALDMNSFPIMNLPPPGSSNSPARLIDVTSTNPITISLSLAGDVTAPASSGVLTTTVAKVNGVSYPTAPSTNTVPVVTSSNTITYQQVNNAQIAAGTITSANIGTNVVGNTNIRQGVARSVIGVTGNATANEADIQGTTRQVLAVNVAGTGLVFAQPQGDQLLGTITNDSATSGNIGEYISATVNTPGSAISTNTPANITSTTIGAGDYDVWGIVYFVPASTTSVTIMQSSISTTSATISQTPGNWQQFCLASAVPVNSPISFTVGPIRLSLASTTTIYLVAQAQFATSTMTAYGTLQIRRVR